MIKEPVMWHELVDYVAFDKDVQKKNLEQFRISSLQSKQKQDLEFCEGKQKETGFRSPWRKQNWDRWI